MTERGSTVLGAVFSDEEVLELVYVLKREMEELLLDLEDERLAGLAQRSMEERYHTIFHMFTRFATPAECSRYVRSSGHRDKADEK